MDNIRFEIDKRDLRELANRLDRLEPATTRAFEYICGDIVAFWRAAILNDRAVETTRYLHSVGLHRLSAREFLADTSNDRDVRYSDVLERGRASNKHGRGATAGRYSLRDALETLRTQNRIENRIHDEYHAILQHGVELGGAFTYIIKPKK